MAGTSQTKFEHKEPYTHGQTKLMTRSLGQRTVTSHAAFFIPYLRPGMSVLDCGCGPGSITIAILRSHLWDIDILIRRTLVYGVLTALLAFVYLGAVIALQTIFAALTGAARSELVTVLSTRVIAALFVPPRHRLQALIDHCFYRRRYDAARALAAFSGTIRDEVVLGRLAEHLTQVVAETLQPAHVSLWLQSPEGEVNR